MLLFLFPLVQGPPVDVEARRPFIDRMLASRSRPPAPGSAASMGPSKQANHSCTHLLCAVDLPPLTYNGLFTSVFYQQAPA